MGVKTILIWRGGGKRGKDGYIYKYIFIYTYVDYDTL